MCPWPIHRVSWPEMGGLRKVREVSQKLGNVKKKKKRQYIRHVPVKGIPQRAEGSVVVRYGS